MSNTIKVTAKQDYYSIKKGETYELEVRQGLTSVSGFCNGLYMSKSAMNATFGTHFHKDQVYWSGGSVVSERSVKFSGKKGPRD